MADHLRALSALAARVGANVAPGQTVLVRARLGLEPLARGVAAACYDLGAHQVEVQYDDPYLQRTRLEHAPDEALGEVIPWARERPKQLAALHGALIGFSGPAAPGLLDDLDPARVGRDTVPLVEWNQVVGERSVNWTIVPGPSAAWAELVYPELDEERATARLWEQIAHVCRLDDPDPLAAWHRRSLELAHTAEALDCAGLDRLRFQGPGTDLTIGLLPGVRWQGGAFSTAWGREHLPNVPTEEVFTSPDPERTEGFVQATKPLLVSGRAVNGLRVRFEQGRAVEIDADEGAPLLRELVQRDADAVRLGEVALVDGSGRIGPLGTIFHDTLLDENAASHIAFGTGFPQLAPDESGAARINSSAVHTDFMIGSPEVRVTGTTRDGHDVPVLIDGHWAVP